MQVTIDIPEPLVEELETFARVHDIPCRKSLCGEFCAKVVAIYGATKVNSRALSVRMEV